jgi:hypothetical protein
MVHDETSIVKNIGSSREKRRRILTAYKLNQAFRDLSDSYPKNNARNA